MCGIIFGGLTRTGGQFEKVLLLLLLNETALPIQFIGMPDNNIADYVERFYSTD